MANSNKQVLFFGATGYVGGTVLARLLNFPGVRPQNLTAFVRQEETAKVLQEQFQCGVAVGSFDNGSKLEQLASQADVIFSCGELSDNPPAMQAILQGMKQRQAERNTLPIIIHTSGTGVLATDDRGMSTPDMIYDDMDLGPIEKLPADALHRPVELMVIAADKAGYAKTYIISPGTVWGIASGPLVDAKIQRPRSHQIPALIRASLDRKQGGMVGKGVARKPNVNVEEYLFIVLFEAILKDPDGVDHGREGYFFAENGEHSWYDISNEIARVLQELGISESGEPSSFTSEELVKYWGSERAGYGFGASSRCRANRAQKLGWKPLKSNEDMIKSIRQEVYEIMRAG